MDRQDDVMMGDRPPVSPVIIQGTHDLLPRAQRLARSAAILRDERLQVTTGPTGELLVRRVAA